MSEICVKKPLLSKKNVKNWCGLQLDGIISGLDANISQNFAFVKLIMNDVFNGVRKHF